MFSYFRLIKKTVVLALIYLLLLPAINVVGDELDQVIKRGELRHLGIPYANFVTGSGDGLDVEIIKLFASHLGVTYRFVETDWTHVIGDLTGTSVKVEGGRIIELRSVPVKGDLIANGMTKIPWREKLVDFSMPTFPTQVWLLSRADSSLQPIIPGRDILSDIDKVKRLLSGLTVLGKENTCLDPSLYNLKATGAEIKLFSGTLNDLAPAVIFGDAETTILDVPDALIALNKWPGKIKVVGPISERQDMGCGFSKNTPKLRDEFNRFFGGVIDDGTYKKLVSKYYPAVFAYFPDFLNIESRK